MQETPEKGQVFKSQSCVPYSNYAILYSLKSEALYISGCSSLYV
jgi:hypothetical protein